VNPEFNKMDKRVMDRALENRNMCNINSYINLEIEKWYNLEEYAILLMTCEIKCIYKSSPFT
jgi:hypothetical protein